VYACLRNDTVPETLNCSKWFFHQDSF